MHQYAGFFACLYFFLAVVQPCLASEIEQAYQRAANIQRYQTDRWLLNNDVYPHWYSDNDTFWYQHETATGHEYRQVDAAKGKVRLLFDHQALASALHSATKQQVNADKLPLKQLHVSPDGHFVSFVHDKQHWRYQLSDATLQHLAERPDSLLPSADGRYGVFIKEHNVWLHDLQSGEERALTDDGQQYFAYGTVPDAYLRQGMPQALWSPDGQKLLVIQTDERQVDEFPFINFVPDKQVRPTAYSARTALPGDTHVPTFTFWLIDVHSGQKQAVKYPPIPSVRMNDTPISGQRAFWHANGKTLYFVDLARGEQYASVVEVNSTTGQTHVLFEEKSDSYLELSPVIYASATLQILSDSNELIWYSERTGFAHLYLYDLTTGKLKHPITQGNWLVRDLIRVDQKAREAVIAIAQRQDTSSPYHRQIARVNLDSGKLSLISRSEHDHQVHHNKSFQVKGLSYAGEDISHINGVAPSGNYLVETLYRADKPSQTRILKRNGQVQMELLRARMHAFPQDWSWPQPVSLLAADGKTPIEALVFRPSHFDPTKRYPVIDHIYGGPQVAHVPQRFGGNAFINSASLAELGFIVTVIDGRGTALRDKAFRNGSYGKLEAASNLEDHLAALQQLTKRYPQMDLNRLGIYGFSGGGYMAASAMLRYPDSFKVGVAWSGNHDQRLFWHGWGERYQGMPNEENYLQQANVTYTDQLKGKLMLIHGLQDIGVHPAQVFQLTQALIDNNKDFDLVILPKQGHALPGYPMRRMWDYFVHYLAVQEPPAQFLLKSSSDYPKE